MPCSHRETLTYTPPDTFAIVCEQCNTPLGRCVRCHRWHATSNLIHIEGQHTCTACIAAFPTCPLCHGHTPSLPYNNPDTGEAICSECYRRMRRRCPRCSEAFLISDTSPGPLCPGCKRRLAITKNPTFNVNRDHRAVGVEIEFVTATHEAPRWGIIKSDASVGPLAAEKNPNHWGSEFASFPIRGDHIPTALAETCRIFTENGGYVNRTCGLHVHLDVSDVSKLGIERIKSWWLLYEPVFYGIVAAERSGNRYCVPANGSTNWSTFRYHGLNLTAQYEHGTLEFRLHHGSLDAREITEWIYLLLAFVRTHKDIPINPEIEGRVRLLSHRQLLILMFNQMRLPMSIRKSVVRRILAFNRPARRYSKSLKKFVGRTLSMVKTPIAT